MKDENFEEGVRKESWYSSKTRKAFSADLDQGQSLFRIDFSSAFDGAFGTLIDGFFLLQDWSELNGFLPNEILLACSAELTQETIASVVGCNRTTVVRAYRDWREQKHGAVVDQRRFGQHQKPAAEIRRLLREVCADQPSDYGWSRSRWSVELLSCEVERRIGCELSVAQTYQYLREAGCRWRKPQPEIDKRPDDADQKLAEMRQKLLVDRDPTSEIVLYEDEMKVALNPKVRADWMPPRMRTELVTPGQNRGAYVAATYNPQTEHMVWAISDSNDSDLLELLLRMVADRYRGWETIPLVMDNDPTHTSKQTDRVIEEFDGKLKRQFLPKYCRGQPHRTCLDNVTRNHRCDHLDELLEQVYHYLRTRAYEGIEPATLRRQAA